MEIQTIVMDHAAIAEALASGKIVRDTEARESAAVNEADTVETVQVPLAHFQTTVKDMRAALTKAGKVVSQRCSLSILECVMFTVADTWRGERWVTVEGMAADLECSVTVNVPATVQCDGYAAVNLRTLRGALKGRKAGEVVTVERRAGDGNVCVTVGDTVHTMPAFGPDEWPRFTMIEDGEIASVEEGQLHSILGDVQAAILKEGYRQQLQGALLERDQNGAMRAVATDGHRLHVRTTETAWPDMGARIEDAETGEVTRENGLIVPRMAVERITALTKGGTGDVIVESDGKHATFVGDAWEVQARLIDSKFPDWQRVMPDAADRCQVATVRPGPVVEVCKVIGRGAAEFHWADAKIRATGPAHEIKSEHPMPRLNGECSHERIGMNAAYVADVLDRFAPDGPVDFRMGDKDSYPVLVMCDARPEFTAVMMPVRL